MLEKILMLPSLIAMSIGGWFSSATPTPSYTPTLESSIQNEVNTTAKTLVYNDISYQLYDYSINQPENLEFQLNKEESTASDLYQKHQCQLLVNGGFYDPDFQPLGLIRKNGTQLNPASKATLLNGFVNFNEISQSIDRNPAQTDATTVQSGPLLIEHGSPRKLVHLPNDAARRRLLAAIDETGMLHFMVVTQKDVQFSGPKLADLPAILHQYNQEGDQPLETALNLDGGSASAYITPSISLSELKPIGSFFCYTPQ